MQLPGKGLIFRGLIVGVSKALDVSPMIAHLLVWVVCGALLFWLDPFPQSQEMKELTDADRAYAKLYCLNGVPHPAPLVRGKSDDQAYLKRLCAAAERLANTPTASTSYSVHLIQFAAIWLVLHALFASIWYWVFGPNYLTRPRKGGGV